MTLCSATHFFAGTRLRAHLSLASLFGLIVGFSSSMHAAGMNESESGEARQTKKRSNILFILTDDQAPWALGLSGDPNALTPNLDALIHSGAYLPNSFVATPVCSPSRASLMTSRYGTEVGITDWIRGGSGPEAEPDVGLDDSWVTFPKLLRQAGYHTGLFGKWHIGNADHFHPTRFGFDYFLGHRSGGWAPENPQFEKDGVWQDFEGLSADVLADEVIRFLERNQFRDNPFLVCWHTRAPHSPWLPVSEEDWAPYADYDPVIPNPDYPGLHVELVKKQTREYLASVRSVDRNVGRVVDRLKELGMAENTVIIFTSDHGYNMGHNGIVHKGNGVWILRDVVIPENPNIKRSQRPNMYDNSLRVPTGVVWPGRIPAGEVITRTVTNLDWFPTLLAIADIPVPEDLHLRGRNILPLLEGKNVEDWNDDLYAQYSTHHQSRTHMRAYRTPEWKLVRDFLNPERDELYDLQNDPEESENLIDSKDPAVRKIVQDLHRKLIAEMREISDPALEYADRKKVLRGEEQ